MRTVLYLLAAIGTTLAGSAVSTPQVHPLGHRRAVFVAQMAVCLGYEQAPIFVPEPARYCFEVNTSLDGIGAKEVAQTVVVEMRKL
jgi:hypothetical protein